MYWHTNRSQPLQNILCDRFGVVSVARLSLIRPLLRRWSRRAWRQAPPASSAGGRALAKRTARRAASAPPFCAPGPNKHHQTLTVHQRRLFHRGNVRHVARNLFERLASQLRVRDFTRAKENANFDLVAPFDPIPHAVQFETDVIHCGLGANANFFDLDRLFGAFFASRSFFVRSYWNLP